MQFELTREFLQQLKDALVNPEPGFIRQLEQTLHPADFAEIFDELSPEEAKQLYAHLDPELAADILVEMEEEARELFLASVPSEQIAKTFIENMDSDDAADVINELPEKIQQEVMSHIQDIELSSDIVDLLNYDENSAGGIMAKELIKVNVDWDIHTCLKEMRKQGEEIETVYTIYVTDDHNKLLGLLSLKKLIISPENAKVSDIYEGNVISVKTNATKEEVANIMDKYGLVVLPVVDPIGRLAGRITIDDVVDVIRDEAGKDYQMMSGISEDVQPTAKVWILSRARLPWLLAALFGGVLGSRVIGQYEDQIMIHPEMAFFIPMIAAMGGNVGIQSSAIIVQGLANNTLGVESIFEKLIKELGVGLINGIICSGLILVFNMIFAGSLALSLTVSVALLSVIVFAAFFGTFIPLILSKYKIDPALATGPFITTTNDILGVFLYFMIGRLMYTMF